jgi:hypothetical protein
VTNGASITRFDKPVCLDTVLKLKLNWYQYVQNKM